MNTILKTISYKNLSNWSVAHLLANDFDYNEEFPLVRIGNFLTRNKTRIEIEDETVYKRVTIRLYNKGVKLRNTEIGKNIGTKKQFLIKKGHFLLSKIDARNGAFGIATDEIDGAIITADFFAYDIDETKIDPLFLVLITTTEQFQKFAQSASSGTTGRQRIDETKFLDVKIPLPSISQQKDIIKAYRAKKKIAANKNIEIQKEQKAITDNLYKKLGIEVSARKNTSILNLIRFKNLKVWSVDELLNSESINSKYEVVELQEVSEIIMGNSPSSKLITNEPIGYKFIGGAADIENEKIISKRYINNDSKISQEGDILYLIRATIGNPFFCDSSYYLGRGISAIRANESKISKTYLLNVLELFQDSIIKQGTGSTFKQISKPILAKIKIPLPPKEIQIEIAKQIEIQKQNIKRLTKENIKNNDLAKEEFIKEIFN